ncbi:MAG: lamin tail domain-containing protein [Sandaracinus sp.]|nr:lamin tail domain-containing protein [Sandaracinus sp.]MCB9612048.1 lamin tail domain-containing protein [Sandaracinus sp.]MCB9633144.1 lamin tail domain-containing protein [Sandaracinus sp.]
MSKTITLVALLSALFFGCSEGETTPPGTDAGFDAGTPPDGGTPEVDGGPPEVDGGTPGVDASLPPSTLVINEVRASGDDWIEVKNIGGASLDVGGWIVTQVDDLGAPEPARSAAFPDGFELAPGAYFLIVADQPAVLEGLQTECFVEGVTQCLIAEFGISAGDGDGLVILDGSGAVVHSVTYPGGATGADQTWSRLPDGTGDFVVGVPTPLAANATE